MSGFKKTGGRFNLLLLENGEYYFEDFGAIYYLPGDENVPFFHRKLEGRIKLCSSSLLFVPKVFVFRW